MAFHGSRGGSRSRGGGRGANVGASHGRGRGRGGFRGGRGKPVFESARIAQQKETEANEESEPESPSEVEDELESQHESSGDEEPLPVEEDSVPGVEDADEAQEPEEELETATDGLLEEDEDDLEDASDPFEAHFADPDNNVLSKRLKSLEKNLWTTQKLSVPKFGKVTLSFPGDEDNKSSTGLKPISGPAELKLKQKLAGFMSKQRPEFDEVEKYIATAIFSYQDVLYCERRPTNSESLRRLACLHAINHVFRTRDRVIKNNARLAKEENNDGIELRDQGFTRPKVLMILPTRESCVRMVQMITLLCEPDQQENRRRFDDSYMEKEEKFSDDKPQDFRELFGGNDDDLFRLGLKFTRKTIKYFSQFYNSDIIFASPLGLKLALQGKEDKNGDYDYLSSIEVVIVDQADALPMQNWEHVEYILEHLNLQPKEAHGCDFSRVRHWYLDNNAKYFRQTITLAAFNTPDLNTLFTQSKNWAGKIKVSSSYSGAIQELGLKVKQTFSRFESLFYASDPEARFTYFATTIIPSLTRRAKDSNGTVIFIPSTFDFYRVRNYFSTSPATRSLSFGSISEYTEVKDVARARSHFFSGRHSILLYTERGHHFRRYQLRGVRRVIMYGLPDNPIFYREIVGGYLGRSVQEGKLGPGEGTVRVIFSKWDVLKLERIVGTERVGKMIKEKGDTFDFL